MADNDYEDHNHDDDDDDSGNMITLIHIGMDLYRYYNNLLIEIGKDFDNPAGFWMK